MPCSLSLLKRHVEPGNIVYCNGANPHSITVQIRMEGSVMMQLDLEYYVWFGRGDCSDGVPFETEITDEEAALWNEAKEQGIPFEEYPPLQKAVERIYDEAQALAEADFDQSWLYDDDTPEEERGFQDGWSTGVTGWPRADEQA